MQPASTSSVDKPSNDGQTALMRAASWGDTSTVQALLQAEANCKLKCNYGRTALSLALNRNKEEVAKLLRAHGADD